MGLPIDQLIVGSNRNDILTRFFKSGEMKMSKVTPSLSPSMDIQVSSNLERLLFDLFDRKGEKLAAAMTDFREAGSFAAPKKGWAKLVKTFKAHRLDDRETLAAMRDIHKRTGMLVDPHSAIGIAAALAAAQGQQGRRDADHGAGDGASGKVPRRRGEGHRHPPRFAGASGGSALPQGAAFGAAQRPR